MNAAVSSKETAAAVFNPVEAPVGIAASIGMLIRPPPKHATP